MSSRIPEEEACYPTCNYRVLSSFQNWNPGWTHEGCILQSVSVLGVYPHWRHGCSQDETKYRPNRHTFSNSNSGAKTIKGNISKFTVGSILHFHDILPFNNHILFM